MVRQEKATNSMQKRPPIKKDSSTRQMEEILKKQSQRNVLRPSTEFLRPIKSNQLVQRG